MGIQWYFPQAKWRFIATGGYPWRSGEFIGFYLSWLIGVTQSMGISLRIMKIQQRYNGDIWV